MDDINQSQMEVIKDSLTDDIAKANSNGGLVAVRAKMACSSFGSSNPGGAINKVDFGCVYSDADKTENALFTKYTPWGQCTLGIDAEAPAAGFFKPGKKYYVTFTEAPD